MKDNLIINLINSGKYESVSIIAHTRWASVGPVNSKNVHPLVNLKTTTDKIPATFAFVNGDIYNFKEIYKNMVWKKKVDYNLNEENDSIGLAYLFSEKNCFTNLQKIKNNLSKIAGSISGILLSHEDPQKYLIIKKGSQGMFLGKNKDRIYFASDAYGLVEDCNKVYNLDDNVFGMIDVESKVSGLKIYNLESSIEKIIADKDYDEIKISSRDVSKKLFNHYLLKEIYESKDIVESTLRRYIDLI
jgi:glucosamine--fructose-6-phosphate aminotransferase (isomerizing)